MCVCVCVAKPVAVELRCHATALIMSPPEGLGDILFFPGRPDVWMSGCPDVGLSVTNRVRSVT